MRGESPEWRDLLALFPGRCGDFPWPLWEKSAWLPPEARPTCFASAPVSQFLLVCAMLTTGLLKELAGRGTVAARKAACSFSPLLTSLWEAGRTCLAHDRRPVEPYCLGLLCMWMRACVGDDSGILLLENIPPHAGDMSRCLVSTQCRLCLRFITCL